MWAFSSFVTIRSENRETQRRRRKGRTILQLPQQNIQTRIFPNPALHIGCFITSFKHLCVHRFTGFSVIGNANMHLFQIIRPMRYFTVMWLLCKMNWVQLKTFELQMSLRTEHSQSAEEMRPHMNGAGAAGAGLADGSHSHLTFPYTMQQDNARGLDIEPVRPSRKPLGKM